MIQFPVKLVRYGNLKIGVNVTLNPVTGITVTSLEGPSTSVARWNHEVDDEQRKIKVGDKIISINGIADSFGAIINKLQSAEY